MPGFNRKRAAASPEELREASQRYKEIQEELRTMELAPETRHGEERLDRYERGLRLQALRDEFQSNAETQMPLPARGGPMLALIMTVASFLLCSFCAGGTYFGLLLITQQASPQSIADSFWGAMQLRDYTSAHSYFSPTVSVTADQFDTLAKAADAQFGAVVSAAFAGTESSSKTVAVLDYNIRRGKGTPYKVTLTMESIRGSWGIADYGSLLAPPSGPGYGPSGALPTTADQIAERRRFTALPA
jgi:hypothetical protein